MDTDLCLSLVLVAANATSPDPPRFGTEFYVSLFAVITMSVVAVYLRQMNRRHERLLDDLRRELEERHKVEDALRASEGFYHSLVESLPAAILR